MIRVYFTILLTIYIYNVSLVTAFEGPQCFNFIWLGARIGDINCTSHNEDNPHIPCIKPVLSSKKKPNTTKVWIDIKNGTLSSDHLCQLESDTVCIKYTYIYNSAIVNVSYFCGRVIEDQTTPVTSNCYIQYTEGYAIEACACQSSTNNSAPCNSTTRNTYSILITFMVTVVSLSMYKIFNIS